MGTSIFNKITQVADINPTLRLPLTNDFSIPQGIVVDP